MSISKILDSRPLKRKEVRSCHKNVHDCMFFLKGECAAEWCLFEELPKMIEEEKTLTCAICGNDTKTFSIYSGVNIYICPECQEKIKQLINNPTCCICGASVGIGQSICKNCLAEIRGNKDE